MSGVFCPNCGKQHLSADRYCEYCGNDLEEYILRYKSQQMPIRYNNGRTQQAYSGTQPEQAYSGTEPVHYDRTDGASEAAACCCMLCIAESIAEMICGCLDCC